LIRALVLSSLITAFAREARAQGEPMTVTILRRTAVRTAPSASAPAIANVNPATFEVTQFQVKSGFVRLLLAQIDRRRPSSGYGYIDTLDVAIDSGTKVVARARTDTTVRPRTDSVVRARTATAVPSRPAEAAPVRTDTSAPARRDTTRATSTAASTATSAASSTDAVPRATPRSANEIIIRPDAPPPQPSAVDSPDLTFLKQGPLAAILQRPMSYRIGGTRDSIVVPAGFVAQFASIPRYLWSELSPVGEQQRAAIVHDYLYWFQPCEREEADNLLMIAMKADGVSDLRRGAVYAGVRVGSADAWNAARVARDRGDLRIVPTQVGPRPQESWSDFRARLGRADIRGTPGRMPRQAYCELGRSQ
jgi:hypothetical protein